LFRALRRPLLQVDQDHREDKLSRNHALFLKANDEHLDLFCECSDESCTVPIKVALDHYGQVRACPDRFLIYPRHDSARIERVVDRGRGYEVVELFRDVALLAADLDPRRTISSYPSASGRQR